MPAPTEKDVTSNPPGERRDFTLPEQGKPQAPGGPGSDGKGDDAPDSDRYGEPREPGQGGSR